MSAIVNTVRATSSIPTGKTQWECVPQSLSGSNMYCGIASANANLEIGLGYDSFGWGYRCDGVIQNNGQRTSYGPAYGVADVVGMLFDEGAGTLEFVLNGTRLGVAFSGLSGVLFPAGSVQGAGSSLLLRTIGLAFPIAGYNEM